MGSAKEKEKWIKGKVERWVQDVRVMAGVAAKYPQAVYIGFVKCKQAEWQYVQRVVATIRFATDDKFDRIKRWIARGVVEGLV